MAESIHMECVYTTNKGSVYRKSVTLPVKNNGLTGLAGYAIASVIHENTVRPMLCLATAVAELDDRDCTSFDDKDVDQAEEAFINAAKLFRTAYGRYDAKNKLDGVDTELLDMKKGTERW